MSEFFDEIMYSIDETIEASKKDRLKETIIIKPVKKYNAEGVKQIRQSLNMTQAVFAGMMGVSQKTVEAWESGRNVPMGPASRFLDLLMENKKNVDYFIINRPMQEMISGKSSGKRSKALAKQ